MPSRTPDAPRPRAATARDTLREALLTAREARALVTARDLSVAASIPEKEVPEHLEHLARSLTREGWRLEVEAATCLACGYVFRDRQRWSVPSACPECRSERVKPQGFRVAGDGHAPTKARRPRTRDDDGDDEA